LEGKIMEILVAAKEVVEAVGRLEKTLGVRW